MIGTIKKIVNHGTMVEMVVSDIGFIPIDHRYFNYMLKGEGDLIGREIEFDENTNEIFFMEGN